MSWKVNHKGDQDL